MHPSTAVQVSRSRLVQTGPDWSDPPVPTTGSDQLQGTPAWGGSFRSPAQGERCENAVLVWDSCLIMITPSPAPFLSSSTPVTAALGSGDSPWSWRQSLGLGTVPGDEDSPRMCRVSSRGAGALLLGLGTVPGALLLSLGLCSCHHCPARGPSPPSLPEMGTIPVPQGPQSVPSSLNHRNHRGAMLGMS